MVYLPTNYQHKVVIGVVLWISSNSHDGTSHTSMHIPYKTKSLILLGSPRVTYTKETVYFTNGFLMVWLLIHCYLHFFLLSTIITFQTSASEKAAVLLIALLSMYIIFNFTIWDLKVFMLSFHILPTIKT